ARGRWRFSSRGRRRRGATRILQGRFANRPYSRRDERKERIEDDGGSSFESPPRKRGSRLLVNRNRTWIPAFAGMTEEKGMTEERERTKKRERREKGGSGRRDDGRRYCLWEGVSRTAPTVERMKTGK